MGTLTGVHRDGRTDREAEALVGALRAMATAVVWPIAEGKQPGEGKRW